VVGLTELIELRNPADYVYKNQKQNWAVQFFFSNTWTELSDRTTKKLTVSILTKVMRFCKPMDGGYRTTNNMGWPIWIKPDLL